MTFQQLRYVAETARICSINKAARNLHVSQPAMSAAIKDLEEELGTVLFERTHSGVVLTAEGTDFLGLAEGILSQVDRIQQMYRIQHTDFIRFQVSSQHYAFVVDAFIQFMDLHKDDRYTFSVKETKTLEVIDDVALRRSAIGIICLTKANADLIGQILARKMLRFNDLVVVTPHVFLNKRHPLAKKNRIELSELAPYPAVMYAQGSHEHLDETNFMEEALPIENSDKTIYTHDRGTMNNILANTHGYNIGSGYLIAGIIPDEIISIPVQGLEDSVKIGWIYPAQRRPTDNVLSFVKLLDMSLKNNHPANDPTQKNRRPSRQSNK